MRKTTFPLVGTLLFIILFSCQTESVEKLHFKKYHLVSDSCKVIEVIDSKKIVVHKSCGNHNKDKSVGRGRLDGSIAEYYCNDLTYQIDSVDRYDGFFLSAYDRNKNKCFGFHLMELTNQMVVTPLKIGERINDHFTQPVIYKEFHTDTAVRFDQELIIKLPELQADETILLAYGQKGVNNSKVNQLGNTMVKLKELKKGNKTNLLINPAFYAFKKYKIVIGDQELRTVPVVYSSDYAVYRNMNEKEKIRFRKKRKILDEFVLIGRFNPSRTRVVNKAFDEEIVGQVQDFKLIKITF